MISISPDRGLPIGRIYSGRPHACTFEAPPTRGVEGGGSRGRPASPVLFDIDEMVIRPVAQATATVLARKT